jgi:class 3 adenylate cyclase
MTANPRTASEPLPSGTVTFAFTDIEGGTQRWRRNRPGMKAPVRRHDGVVRETIAHNGGRVAKTAGDA